MNNTTNGPTTMNLYPDEGLHSIMTPCLGYSVVKLKLCFNSLIKFFILLTVNHTFSIGSTNFSQTDIFCYSCHLSG